MIAVILYTYSPSMASPRLQYAEQTLRALHDHLKTEGDLWLHISDDGSPQAYRDYLWDLAGQFAGDHRSITNSERRGYGGSYNEAARFVHALPAVDAILQCEDDWILQRPLDLDPLVRVLRVEPRIGCLRLGYLGYSHPLWAEFIYVHEQHYLLLNPQSPSQYVFSGGPRLETVAWAKGVGPWPEMERAGEVELLVCGRTAARTGVAWPVELVKPSGDLFVHIGTHGVKDAKLGQAVTA